MQNEKHMPLVTTGMSTSLDGFIAGADDTSELPLGVGGDRLFDWFGDGDTPSRFYPSFRMSAVSARYFDEYAGRHGAGITGRRTYDVADAWGGSGPLPGVQRAVELARAAAGSKDVSVMGASIVQQCLRAGLMDEIVIHLVPVVLGRGVRLLDGLESGAVELELERVVDAPGVTHLTYRVVK